MTSPCIIEPVGATVRARVVEPWLGPDRFWVETESGERFMVSRLDPFIGCEVEVTCSDPAKPEQRARVVAVHQTRRMP